MSESVISYGLTTKARVKDRINISTANHDALIDRLISGVTDLIEGECGGRRFKRSTYTNEIITIRNANQRFLLLKNTPIISVSSLQYRTGLKSNPNYTDFNNDDWEIVNDGASGMIEVYGLSRDVNFIRISYVAGYLIDFDTAGSATHTLPFDLSDLAERLTIKLFKRREHEGKSSETFESGTVQWKDLIDPIDRAVINRYSRIPQFV